MGRTWKNESHLEEWVSLGKMRQTSKNESQLEGKKMGHTCKNGSH